MRDDDDLLAACLRGEQAAWNALIDRYAALIYSIPLKYGLNEQDAADVFQSVCVSLFQNLGSIRDRTAPTRRCSRACNSCATSSSGFTRA